jgi:diaminopimelate epimerase
MSLFFHKMQGVGNDFVLIDGRGRSGQDWPALAIEMCDRHFGVGADGLLVIDHSETGDVAMRMFNPDGTPDVCGNGLRCVARYLMDRGEGRPLEDGLLGLEIETLAGVRRATRVESEGSGGLLTVNMGMPLFAPGAIPMSVELPQVVDYPLTVQGETVTITALSTGSTHSIIFVDNLPEDDAFIHLSRAIENHPLFPERASVMWAKVEDAGTTSIRIWERGAGETWGCGTGACAVGVASTLHGYTKGEVAVKSRGGVLSIQWEEGKPILMTGPAEYVFEGCYTPGID